MTRAFITETPNSEECTRPPSQLRVYLMDLWSFIPYYVARLCLSLRDQGVDARLASVRYHLDRNYFHAAGLVPESWLLDFGGNISNSFLRRICKTAEYALNLCLLGFYVLRSKSTVLHVQYLPFLDLGLPVEIWFLQWIRKHGVSIVYTVHNMTNKQYPDRHKSLYKRVYQVADILLCHGKEARAGLLREFGIPLNQSRIIPHGPLFEEKPAASAREARAKLGLPLEEPLVLCMGIIRDYKGIPFLLEAWKLLIDSGGKGRLLIAGTGGSRVMSSIREKVSTDGLKSSVELWLRYIPVEQLPLLYQAADILVYPYKAGTTSGALLTGLTYGKAIVATKLPFFCEYLRDGENALLVDYGDVDGLASSLLRLIYRPEERLRIASSFQEENTHGVSWSEIAKATSECYQSLVKPRPVAKHQTNR